MGSSLEVDDNLSKSVATHPRVSLADLEANIKEEHYFLMRDALNGEAARLAGGTHRFPADHPTATMTVCVLVLQNGFIVVGKATPASPENFDPMIGRRFALEDAMRQMWPIMAYALKERMLDRENDRVARKALSED